MGSFQFEKGKAYMMPIMWGPSSCFRDENGNERHFPPTTVENLQVVFETNPEQLDKLLPPECTLKAPLVAVQSCKFGNVGWLGGHDYHLILILTPVHFKGTEKECDANFVLSCIENHADPILAGREFGGGFNKPWADIHEFVHFDGKYTSMAYGWDDPVMKLVVDTQQPLSEEEIAAVKSFDQYGQIGGINWWYIEDCTAEGNGKPVANSFVLFTGENLGDDYEYKHLLVEPTFEYGEASIEFMDTTWQNMPMWYNHYHGLSQLEVRKVLGGFRQIYSDANDYKVGRFQPLK